MNCFEDCKRVFNWINEPKQWEVSKSKLSVIAQANTDFFIDEEGPSIRDSAPFLLYTSTR